jgi:protein-disulfide isomerase
MLRKIPGLSGLGAATLVAATVGLGCQGSGSVAKLQESLTEIRDSQQTILARIDQLEEKIGTAAAAPARPDQRPQARPGQPDPAKTYKVPLGDAHTKGPSDAKVTIVEWSDYQ